MKTPKKVIEKISLPLMFVTFVMAVLMFAVNPVSAAPDLCQDPDKVFCDQDGDGYIRDHKKCPDYCWLSQDDDDDDCQTPDTTGNSCPVVSSEGDMYTAELTNGAFRFKSPQVHKVIPYDSRNLDLVSAAIEGGDARMSRPYNGCNDWQLGDPILERIGPNWEHIVGDSTVHEGWEDCTYVWSTGAWIPDSCANDPVCAADQETWDHLFSTGCPKLVQTPLGIDPWIVDEFVSSAYNWSWEKPGGRRLVLRNIHVEDYYGFNWEIRVQLIGEANDPEVPEFLPTTGSIKTTLIKGRLEGRTLDHLPGDRKSCAQKGDINTLCEADNSSPSGKIEGFCLLDWENNPSEMEIEILPPTSP